MADEKMMGSKEDDQQQISDEEANQVTEPEERPTEKGAEKNPESKKEESRRQSAEENAIWKQRRLEWEAREKELKDKLQKATDTIAGLRSQNVADKTLKDLGLTKDDLKDPENLKLAEYFAEGQQQGLENPAAYAYRKQLMELKGYSEQQRKAQEAKAKIEQDARADREKANAKYGADFVAQALARDSAFMKNYGAILNHDNFLVLLDVYSKTSEKAAREQGSFAGSGGRRGGAANENAASDFSRMSDKDFLEFKRKNGLL